jgi:putative phosphoesterase
MKIGLISDTHGFLDEKVFSYFDNCDEIWHAGDVGTAELTDKLAAFKPLRAVYGNIDGQDVRAVYPKDLFFEAAGCKVWMTHIGGYPGHYAPEVRKQLQAGQVHDIFICGHSHILRVMPDPKFNNMLTINPGAAGKHGFHKIRTLLRMELLNGKVRHMEAIELGPRAVRL